MMIELGWGEKNTQISFLFLFFWFNTTQGTVFFSHSFNYNDHIKFTTQKKKKKNLNWKFFSFYGRRYIYNTLKIGERPFTN